jgi:PAS domain S-box-containing protein
MMTALVASLVALAGILLIKLIAQHHELRQLKKALRLAAENKAAESARTEVTRRRSEETTRQLLQAQRIAKIGHWVTDEVSQVTTWSPELFELFNIPPKASWPVAEALALVHPDDIEALRQQRRHAAASQTAATVENRWVRPDGVIRWMHIEICPEYDITGRCGRLFGTMQDITERKEAEEALKAAQQQLVDAVESISEGFVLFDRDDRYVLTNSKYREMYAGMVDMFAPGSSYEAMLRTGIERGAWAITGDREEFAQRLLEWHRGCGPPMERQLADGRWIRAAERRTRGGGIVGIRTDITEQKRAETALRAAQQQLVDAIESISEGFVLFDRDDRYVLTNTKYREMYPNMVDAFAPGTPYETMLRVGFERGLWVRENDVDEWIRRTTEWHHACGEPQERQLADDRWMRLSEHRTRDGGIVGIRTDITERKKSEEALKAAQQQLIDAIESISEGFVIYDRDDRFVMCNDAYRRLFPHSAELMVPATPDEQIVRANIAGGRVTVNLEKTEDWLTQHLIDHRNAAGAVEIPLANGQWLLVTERRMRDGGLAGLRVDITKLKAAEAQLRQNKETLSRAQRLAKIGSFEHDLRTGEVVCSEELYRIFGWDQGVTPPRLAEFLALIHLDDRAAYVDSVRATNQGLPAPPVTHRMQFPDGSVKWMYTELDLIRDEQGTPIRRVGITRDITEKREAQAREQELERQLLHSQRLEALGTLAGGVAHELNNALVPILALAAMARDELPESNSLHQDLETIVRASERARDLVKQILAFSRKQDVARQEVDLAPVAREALQMLRASVPATIEIVNQILEVPPLLGDPGALRQVIVNLVTNAAQAVGDEVGRITVRLWATAASLPHAAASPTIFLSVADTGCGMDEATVGRIFEPFFTTKGVGEGTGLGLSVVHGIITRHGGSIKVRSEPGKGSEFELSLPTAAQDCVAPQFGTAAA